MKIRKLQQHPEFVQFFCPGCNRWHTVHILTRNSSGAIWSFNGDINRPTFIPSINLRTGIYADPSWKEPDNNHSSSEICHSKIKDGSIEYLLDCTHTLKGKTVELPDV